MIHTISEFFTSINAPTGAIVIWSIVGFILCWLTVFLLGIATAKLIEDKDRTEQQDIHDVFANIGNTIFFMGGIYSLALFFWYIGKFVVISQIVMWIITIMAAIDLLGFFVRYIILGIEWATKEAKYYKYNKFSEKIKNAAFVVLLLLADVIGYGIYIGFTCMVIFN